MRIGELIKELGTLFTIPGVRVVGPIEVHCNLDPDGNLADVSGNKVSLKIEAHDFDGHRVTACSIDLGKGPRVYELEAGEKLEVVNSVPSEPKKRSDRLPRILPVEHAYEISELEKKISVIEGLQREVCDELCTLFKGRNLMKLAGEALVKSADNSLKKMVLELTNSIGRVKVDPADVNDYLKKRS